MNGTCRVVIAREEITTRCALCLQTGHRRAERLARSEESSESRNDDIQVSVGIAMTRKESPLSAEAGIRQALLDWESRAHIAVDA